MFLSKYAAFWKIGIHICLKIQIHPGPTEPGFAFSYLDEIVKLRCPIFLRK
jgi:hypothetical protein